ncbi:LysR family transcriptional regulator [Methylosinus sp. C49]|uniref:LysR substrate-binding domain-containing protein n=1 Tax=Methylosinus sp. C49 TaxID=2699395 RepID=UPI00136726BF|nr:LysR substrate-binding domain-containing protein [Methylosinus sp. C49]BBU60568.1 LysR family transcriptional regulator [Methylosinus sp. C49]
MRALPSLVSLRAFEAAARRESFKLAAAELGVTPTAISHQIKGLETDLGLRLFTRKAREVALTPQGLALYLDLRVAFDSMAEAIDRARRPTERKQAATLSATVAFTSRALAPRAESFRGQNPGWDLRLHASDRPANLRAGEADAAIRCGVGQYSGQVATPLFTDRYAPVCSPRLDIRRPKHLAGATLIHREWGPHANGPRLASWRRWADERGAKSFDPEVGTVVADEESAIRAAVAGQGVALASLPLVAAELASGALVQPFGPVLDGLQYDFVHPLGAEDRPAVAALKDWVVAEFAAAEPSSLSRG